MTRVVMLAGVVMAVTMAAGRTQDVADCVWHPDSDLARLDCSLKTLQTGPAVIPQVSGGLERENGSILGDVEKFRKCRSRPAGSAVGGR